MMGAHDTAVATAEVSVSEKIRDRESHLEIIGTTLSGRYLVTRKIGQGGMGAVYEATHTLIGKRVAVKVLLEKYAQREAIIARLKQEAQLASSVGNEHIIDITDFGSTDDGRTFVVMEFLEGESLAECLARESQLPEQRILRIASQVASALVAAHEKGVVHRDIKPENLFLLKRKDQDFVKVVDFGISKSLRASSEEEEAPRLTQTGMVLGTPLYMSPEQARGDDELDHRVDVYALGVIMYEVATGRVPFAGNNYLSVISQVLNETPKPPRELRPELSEEFDAIVMRAMAKDRRERYADAGELLNDITALLDDPTRSTERAKITGPRKLRRPGGRSGLKLVVWIAAICVIVAAIATTVVMMMDGKEEHAKTGSDGSNHGSVPPPMLLDAALPLAPDAFVKVEMLKIHATSVPPGATIIMGGIQKCEATPCDFEVVKGDRLIDGVAQLEGYDEYAIKFNPLDFAGNEVGKIVVKLSKPKPGTPKSTPPIGPKKGSGSAGSATTPEQTKGNPDLGGNPFGAAPKAK